MWLCSNEESCCSRCKKENLIRVAATLGTILSTCITLTVTIARYICVALCKSTSYGVRIVELFYCLQALAMFFASLCHDLDHRGRTNSWMKNEQTPLAAVYSTSTMEHHHFNQTITILQVWYHSVFS